MKLQKVWLVCLMLCGTSLASAATNLATEKVIGKLEVVATFPGAMPTGVTVSDDGRIFVNFPKWGDNVEYTVAEVKNGKTQPYPDAAINKFGETDKPEDKLVSVQSVVVDPTGKRLWILDTGSVGFGPVTPGGAKLIAVDLNTNKVIKKIIFPNDVALVTSYLNDVRFDLRRGKEGIAFITDSTMGGPNAIIVVDIATGTSWRRLNDHPSTKADLSYTPVVEAEFLQIQMPNKPAAKFTPGADGIAISPDGKTLYYSPLISHRLYSVSVDALVNRDKSESDVASTVKDLGERPGASDGLESDAQGRVYLSDYEHNAIHRLNLDGSFETLVHDPRALWPDTLSLASDGYLYFTANQLNRMGLFHGGKDMRQRPYVLFRTKVDGTHIHQ